MGELDETGRRTTGRIVRVFSPPLWQIWKWLWWFAPVDRADKSVRVLTVYDERGNPRMLRTRFVIHADRARV